jgi:hypothetical protein
MSDDEEDIPRRRSPFPAKELTRILMLIMCLVIILLFRKSCAEGVGRFVGGYGVVDAGRPRGDATR